MASQPPPSRDLLVRTLSACVFVPAILLAAYAGGRWLLLLVLLIVGRGSWELFVLAARAGRHPSRALGIAGALGLSLLAYGSGTQHLATALVAVALLALADALRHGTQGYLASALLTVGGVVYTGLLGSAPLLIGRGDAVAVGPRTGWLLVAVFGCIWLTDAAAYLAGRRFGRRKLAPGISPGKTRVGFVAGLAAGLLPVACHRLLPGLSPVQLLGLLFAVSLASQVGDLVESAIKRDLGVKDAPPLIPGHGGVLDRFDSYLFAFPVTYLYLLACGTASG